MLEKGTIFKKSGSDEIWIVWDDDGLHGFGPDIVEYLEKNCKYIAISIPITFKMKRKRDHNIKATTDVSFIENDIEIINVNDLDVKLLQENLDLLYRYSDDLSSFAVVKERGNIGLDTLLAITINIENQINLNRLVVKKKLTEDQFNRLRRFIANDLYLENTKKNEN